MKIDEINNLKNLPIYFDESTLNDIDKICTSIRKLIVYHKDIEIKRDNIIGVIEMPNEIRNSPSITINFLNKELFFLCRA